MPSNGNSTRNDITDYNLIALVGLPSCIWPRMCDAQKIKFMRHSRDLFGVEIFVLFIKSVEEIIITVRLIVAIVESLTFLS